MSQFRNLISSSALVAVLFGCVPQKEATPVKATPLTNHTYLSSKLEGDNKMDLYSVKGEVNILEFMTICESKKNSSYTFYFVVLFDDIKNASFPKDPFTAQYGMEEDSLSHIKAIYENNTVNGYSVLTYYDTNAWEGKATRVKL